MSSPSIKGGAASSVVWSEPIRLLRSWPDRLRSRTLPIKLAIVLSWSTGNWSCSMRLLCRYQGTSTIVVAGEIDAHSVDALNEALDGLDPHQRIDLSACTFMDSSGIACLVHAKTSTETRNGSITLIAPSDPVRRLLTICGLVDAFAIELDVVADGLPK